MKQRYLVTSALPYANGPLHLGHIAGAYLPADIFVDQYALICGEGQMTCPVFTPNGELISFDGGHLTKQGASFVGERIFLSAALSQLK